MSYNQRNWGEQRKEIIMDLLESKCTLKIEIIDLQTRVHILEFDRKLTAREERKNYHWKLSFTPWPVRKPNVLYGRHLFLKLSSDVDHTEAIKNYWSLRLANNTPLSIFKCSRVQKLAGSCTKLQIQSAQTGQQKAKRILTPVTSSLRHAQWPVSQYKQFT